MANDQTAILTRWFMRIQKPFLKAACASQGLSIDGVKFELAARLALAEDKWQKKVQHGIVDK